jgi:UDP-N-acetylmuramoylalanine--D-glutamate ligase
MNEKINQYFNKIKDKKILIQGLGLNGGGVGTALFFLENGFNVTITDLKNEKELSSSMESLKKYSSQITYVLGEHREKDFLEHDIIVKGPGVNPSNKFIQLAIKSGRTITSDIDIFFQITPCGMYGVTGSKGKSTAVTIIYNIFKAKQPNSFLGGNITISPLTFYKELNKESLVILEMSSWQLRDLKDKNFNFKVAGITNLLNDHQNYYSSLEDYLSDKKIIADNQTGSDFLLLPFNDNYLNKKNIPTKANIYYYSFNDDKADFYFSNNSAFYDAKEKLFDLGDIKIPGEHMHTNILFAAAFCYLAGIEKKAIKEGISTFKGAPYRMELVRVWNGIKFINDTTATIPDAAYNALLSFKEPIIWIAGGNDKNLDFQIIQKVSHIPKKIFLLQGEGTEKMKKFIDRTDIIENNSLENLLRQALNSAVNGDVILLSPGCTSFGLFQNEFHRGDVFNKFVNELE